MKNKKPFKVNATYRIRMSKTHKFDYDDYHMQLALGVSEGDIFEFTPDHVDNEGNAFYNDACIALATERNLFTRIDNKGEIDV